MQIINWSILRVCKPNRAPAGVKIKKIIINKEIKTDVFIKELLNNFLKDNAPSNLQLKQWKIWEIARIEKANVEAIEVSPKSMLKAKESNVIIVI